MSVKRRNPYVGLPDQAFWKSGVGDQHPLSITGLYTKKFTISQRMKIATAGSCFAQHIGGHLRKAGYSVMDVEPAPPSMTDETARKFGWRIYSARYGNIYLAEQLLQIAKEAYGLFLPANAIWEKNGRFYDAMRPSVEPEGFDDKIELAAHRGEHLKAVRTMFEEMDLFIFTFGLTEGWVHKETGTVYPTAPGTIAGSFDPDVYEFKNFRAAEIKKSFLEFRRLIKQKNPKVKFLITVSPVPLTATASNQHVLAATTYSKSVLRTVAGELTANSDIDYFPSYELIASPFSRGFFYSPNLRTVEAQGVEAVMRVFFDQHPPKRREATKKAVGAKTPTNNEIVCEEALLGAFAK